MFELYWDFTIQSRRRERQRRRWWPQCAWPWGRPGWDWGRAGTRRQQSGPTAGMSQNSPVMGKEKRLVGLQIKSNILIQNKWHHIQIHQWDSDYGVKVLVTFWTDSNALTVLNKLKYDVVIRKGSTMKHHSWQNTAETTLFEVRLPGLEEIPGTDWQVAGSRTQWYLCTRAQPSCVVSPGTALLVPVDCLTIKYFFSPTFKVNN